LSGWALCPVRRAAIACAALWLGLAITACATPYEEAYGRSYEEHTARSIANPEAGMDDLEAPRPDGPSTDNALYKMRTQETKIDEGEEPSVVDIDIGGGS
jgi:hypothetical protein